MEHPMKLTVGQAMLAALGSLSQSVGAERFGTAYRYRNAETGRFDGAVLPVDLGANAPDSQSWWDVPVAEASELESVRQARAAYESAQSRQRRYL
jgi:3D-(3,5/4)-trihydroxycyclohexane-1,2-dione acylhydrolase (decyclizing)